MLGLLLVGEQSSLFRSASLQTSPWAWSITHRTFSLYRPDAISVSYIYSLCMYLLLLLLLFLQCALDQLFAFCTNKVLETKVAGKMASDMCRAAARVSLKKQILFWYLALLYWEDYCTLN